MLISRIRFWLSQQSAQGIHRNLELHYSDYKVLYKRAVFKPDPKVVALRNKLLYCDHLDFTNLNTSYKEQKLKEKRQHAYKKYQMYRELAHKPVYSTLLHNVVREEGQETMMEQEEECTNTETKNWKPVHMPYSRLDTYKTTNIMLENDTGETLNKKYKDMYENYLETKRNTVESSNELTLEDHIEHVTSNTLPKGELWKVPSTWMSDYEQYDEQYEVSGDTDWYKNYGTPDPSSQVTSVPCGGCGALLHCKDPAIPGYLPSELILHRDNEDLKATICQRCHFLKFYNAALEVKVSIEDYPKLLSIIKRKKCAILLIVDLTDFPCSIWPNLKSILHPFTPIFLVGNKVDLLPRDSLQFFDNVKNQLLNSVIDITGVNRANITHVELTSAKTGFGIEELISKLQSKWRHKGDVYMVGCTNVGKSSMFNTLLNSDYCKVQAIDLIQRATISPWPGTTLNLLKFPILNPTNKKRVARTLRLEKEQIYKQIESSYKNDQFKDTKKMNYATLEGYIGRTFSGRSNVEKADSFSEVSHKFMERKLCLDESLPEYSQSRWCYDTPGTIQQDQILDLLTTDELLATLPETIITPRTFIFRPKETVFVAGMGRLDFVEGDLYIRCTLFTSRKLPITMCYTDDADDVYNQLLETEAFVVPTNDPERLKTWPKLKSKEMKLTGVNKYESVADIVLSSIGWIAITAQENQNVTLNAWTPEGRGIYLRSPALLKKSVTLRGAKIQGTPMYTFGRKVYVK
ncbi:nitric oxide-associated protein 1 [Colletes latitarsis]|uniref:nitric oxide-associated protein 1 n=1 Tax=Colletes latitarsis TaxID=2605962 RepID=UPI004035D7C9